MKNTLLFTLAFFSVITAFSQQLCLPAIGGSIASDEPPGCLLCTNEYEGSTRGFTADTFAQSLICRTVENNQWLSVQADFEGEINLRFEINNCGNQRGIEVLLLSQNLEFIRCTSFGVLRDWNITGLEPGEIYWLMIDGIDGDVCDFTIRRTVPRGFVTLKTNNAGRRQVCPGAEVYFKASLGFPASQYGWDIDTAGLTILSGGGLLDSFVCIRFDSVGTTNISLNTLVFCNANHFTEKQINIIDAPVFSRTRTHSLCLSEMPHTEFGQQLDSFGFTRIVYQTAEGCDSVYEFTINRFLVEEKGSGEFCEGDTIVIDNQPITENGSHEFFYEFGDENQCDSLFSYNFIQIDTAAPEITCFVDTFVRGVGIKWEPNPFILEYKLRINDKLITLGNQSSYLYRPQVPNEVLNISLEARSDRCFHHISYAQCIGSDKVLNVSEVGEKLIKVFPNPSSGIFKIQTVEKNSETLIFDFSGKRVLKTSSSEIDLSKQPSGVYFFKIRTSTSFFIKKVVKI